MGLSRRHFLAVSAGALAGCGRVKSARTDLLRFVGKPTHPPLEQTLTAPAGSELDDVSHFINRLTFGPRPGEYARVARLGVGAFLEEQLAPEKLEDLLCERVIRHEFDTLAEPESRLFPRRTDDKDPLHAIFPTIKAGAAPRRRSLRIQGEGPAQRADQRDHPARHFEHAAALRGDGQFLERPLQHRPLEGRL